MKKETVYDCFIRLMHFHRAEAGRRGELMDVTINYGGEVLTVVQMQSLGDDDQMWLLNCIGAGKKNTLVLCHPLAHSMRFEFRDKKEAGSKREIGFQINGIDLAPD